MKIHECEFGRSYTSAKHLRKHQKNHAQEGVRAKIGTVARHCLGQPCCNDTKSDCKYAIALQMIPR